jgi:hypothetical protein
VLVALAAGLALIVGVGILSSETGSSSPGGSSPPAAVLGGPRTPTLVQWAATTAPPIPPLRDPRLVHVAGQTFDQGSMCVGDDWCQFFGDLGTSNERLPGCYLLQAAGASENGTWGTMELASTCVEGFDASKFEATVSWRGEWFTAGPRHVRPGAGDAVGLALWPVDTIWLQGLGEHKGLSAVLRIDGTGQVDGWLFPMPQQP